ncbi:hypothetical protein HMPREF1326_03068 [Akkermansia sp. KLE1605]|nr:hypothetical protein HMPREF1326_03068 [Akkermansia sp. KLE1605]
MRGLKPRGTFIQICRKMSHLTRGAWIETLMGVQAESPSGSRTSHEVRGLKPANL